MEKITSNSRKIVEGILRMVPQHVGSNILIKHGRVWPCDVSTIAPRPRRFMRQHCYYNAWQLALNEPRKYTYVEGYADMGLMPISHAWVVDSEGNVLDPTWQDLEARKDYFGVPFRVQFLNRMATVTEYAGIFENISAMRFMANLVDQPEKWLAPHPFVTPAKTKKPKKKNTA